MRWWKVGIYASIAWVLLVAVVAGCLLWYISSHPMGPKVDDARHEKAGSVTGMLLGIGLVAIWASLFFRHQKKQRTGEAEKLRPNP
jgi:hypothetical protein